MHMKRINNNFIDIVIIIIILMIITIKNVSVPIRSFSRRFLRSYISDLLENKKIKKRD